MKKLEKLTPEQEAYIPIIRKIWEDVFYKNESLDRENTEKYISWLYKKYLKKDAPTIMVMKSPLGCQLLIHILKKYNVDTKNLRANLGANLGANLRETFEQSEYYYTGIGAYGFAAFYDFIQYTNHFTTYNFKDFDNYKRLLQTGIYELYVFDGLCIICEMPKVKQNEQNQLHNVNGPAVTWRDGWEQYLVNGRHITNETFKKVIEEKLTTEDFFKLDNEETKSAIIALMQERFGEEHVFMFFSKDLKEVDTYVDKKDDKYLEGTTKGMNVGVYTLFKGEINNENVAYVRCYCPSTDRIFFLGVDPQHNNAKDAIASLYRVPKQLRNNIKYIQRQGERFSTVFDEQGTELLKSKKVDCNDTVSITGQEYFNLITYEY